MASVGNPQDDPRTAAGRVALIAGGTGPIGVATARALSARGAQVVVLYRNRSEIAEGLVAELGAQSTMAIRADVGDPGDLNAAVAAAEERFGPVEIVVNAAHPHQPPVAVADATTDQVRTEFDAVAAHASLCSRVVPAMRERGYGRIVYVSGALMSRAVPGFGLYGAAKAAATTLTRYVAHEEGRHGILAGIVAPGRVVDPADDLEPSPEMAEAARHLLSRMALPVFPTSDEVAEAILALVETTSLTGQVLWVTGGEPIWS
ncbi:SDR family oxidoreductase [Microbacter sp. GSS18]|nr:SDR family oxidoreductase [Microbacter sp. GSS18]